MPTISPESAPRSTLTDILQSRALSTPDKPAFVFLRDTETVEGRLTYSELDRRARAVAGFLQDLGAAGERALLLFQPGLDYIAALYGCLYAGVTAVPMYPPRPKRGGDRLRAVVTDARAQFALTSTGLTSKVGAALEGLGFADQPRVIAADTVGPEAADRWKPIDSNPDGLAFLQYTSGSTGVPKGVMVTHGNILHDVEIIRSGFEYVPDTVFLSWLPPYHDMGLVSGIMVPVYTGFTSILMSPQSFLQHPMRWLEAVSKFGATDTGAPNFAFDLCVRKATDAVKASLDLSRVETIYNGAEPIRAETLEAFAAAFAPCGFRREALYPCYGLAEATLKVSGGPKGSGIRVFRADPGEMARNRLREAGENEEAHFLVASGHIRYDQTLRIMNPETSRACSPDEIGEIWVSGGHVASGYWNRPEETEATFRAFTADGEGPFLRTGDLGFMRDGHLFVTGRLKDLVIIRGQNFYPQDIELTVERSHADFRQAGGAAFSVEVGGAEKLVVVQELEFRRNSDPLELVAAIRRSVAEEHDLDCHAVAVIKPGTIPKTSSGKIQRRATKNAFLENSLEIVPGGLWINESTKRVAPTVDHASVVRLLTESVSARAGLPVGDIDPRRPFTDYGLGSADSVALAAEIEIALGVSLAPTVAWDYPTVHQLAAFIVNPDGLPSNESETRQSVSDEPVAVVGMAMRLPGDVNDPESFWKLLDEGRSAVGDVPPGRFGSATNADNRLRWGAFLTDVERFDAEFFRMAPREAVRVDPQHRLLLETAWEALEHAGQSPERAAGTKTGVFIGITHADYGRLQFGSGDIDPYVGTGTALSIAANRISYALDLRGPSLAVDTACSSSLTAVHYACRSLRSGESDMVLAGGVNLILSPDLTLAFSQAGMLASDGRCKTFDAKADGYVRGEGCAVVVLKRFSDALRDGNPVLALIRGSAVNQDGRTNGLTAPNGPAQREVIREALKNAGVQPEDIDYVEAHGTGTPLGDPIEFQSLRAVLDTETRTKPCAVGSVKTNLGHLEAAAGIVGLVKAVSMLGHRKIPPHLNFETLNENISLGERFFIPAASATWEPSDKPRLIGVSSFGFGGTNAHVVVEEFVADSKNFNTKTQRHKDTKEEFTARDAREVSTACGSERVSSENSSLITHHSSRFSTLFLSTRTKPALLELAERYGKFFETHPDVNLTDVCLTARFGRSRFEHRLEVECPDLETVRRRLREFRSDEESGYSFVPAGTRDPEESISEPFLESFRRVHLPTHPFQGKRYWIESADATAPTASREKPSVAKPSRGDILAASGGHRSDLIARYVRAILGRVLKTDASELTADKNLIALGMDSIMVMDLLREIRTDFDLTMYPGEVFKRPTVGDLTAYLAAEVERQGSGFGVQGLREVHQVFEGISKHSISEAQVSVILETPNPEPRTLNPVTNGAFLLSSPRAGSTLLRVMLAGHPDLFCPPELHLLPFDAMDQRTGALAGNWLGEGLERAVKELVGGDAERAPVPSVPPAVAGGSAGNPERARALIETWVREKTPIETVYRALRDMAGGRLLIDKSPSYALSLETLRRAERLFDAPKYVHLVRHPAAVVESFVRNRIDKLFGGETRNPFDLAEAVWRQSNENIRAFFAEIEPDRQLVVRYEDLVADPRRVMEQIAGFLGVPFDEAMLTPYQGNRMTDGLHSASLGIGDPNFTLHSEIDSSLGEAWKTVVLPKPLSESTRRLAHEFGYDIAQPTPAELSPTRNQHSLWFLAQFDPEGTAYNMVRCFRITSELDLSALKQAFQTLFDRHDAPRMIFPSRKGKPFVTLGNFPQVPFEIVDAEHLDESTFRELVETNAHRSFDLAAGPLFRVTVFRRGERDHVLMLDMHHIVSDGWSLTVLIEELSVLYSAERAGTPADLPPPERGFSDFLSERAAWMESPEFQSRLEYWKTTLEDAPAVLDLPTDHPRPATQEFRGTAVLTEIDAELTRSVKTLGKERQATPFMTLLAAYQVFLHKLSGQSDIVTGTPTAGRAAPEYRGTVGYFVNPVPVRTNFSGEPTFSDVLERVRKSVLEALDNQDCPFATLVEQVRKDRDPSRNPIFQTLFTFQKPQSDNSADLSALALGRSGRLRIGDLEVESFPLKRAVSQFDLDLMVAETNDGMTAVWQFDSALFEPATGERFVRQFRNLLKQIAAFPDRKLSELVLTDSDDFKVERLPDYYRVEWREKPLVGQNAAPTGAILVFTDGSDVAESLIERLKSAGTRVVRVRSGGSFARAGDSEFHVAPGDAESFARLFEAVRTPLAGVVYGWGLETNDFESAQRDCLNVSLIVRGLAGRPSTTMFIPTRKAQAVGDESDPISVFQSPLWGFAATATLEHADLRTVLIDLDSATDASDQLFSELTAPDGEDHVARRNGKRFVQRLVQFHLPETRPFECRSDATYLITGGFGGLGLQTARKLAESGARHVALLGRGTRLQSQTDDSKQVREAIRDLENQGVRVLELFADVADFEQAANALERIRREFPPLRGVVHAAGVLEIASSEQTDSKTLERTFRAKARGAWNLHVLTRDADLDFLIAYSSISSVLGTRGLAAYAAANSFLDALVSERKRLGLPALGINWGPWAETGMSVAEIGLLKKVGMEALTNLEALSALAALSVSDAVRAVAARIDWNTFKPLYEAKSRRPLLAEVGPVSSPSEGSERAESSFRDRFLAGLPPKIRLERLRRHVSELVAQVLGFDRDHRLDPDQPLQGLGFDSLMAVDLRNRLEHGLGLALPATLGFDHPTINALCLHIDGLLFRRAEDVRPEPVREAPSRFEPVAVVGMACRFPGGVDSPEAFWELLRSGTDAVGEVPPERWDIREYYDPRPAQPGKICTKAGAFLTDIDRFDPLFFDISPREAVAMDPQQRLLLETTWEALEDAGIRPASLSGTETGVFVGVSSNEFLALRLLKANSEMEIEAYYATGLAGSIAANRISFFFNFQGPSTAMDTACSSSLLAVHTAVQSLRSGESEVALAGGVNILLVPFSSITLSQARMLSPTGRCRAFDADADGYVRGEGAAMIVLKRLSDAERDGDRILAVIRGTATNQDGRSNGLTAPNGTAQEHVIRRALKNAGVKPDEVGYVETHGTGTPLGDPIEIRALTSVLGEGRAVGNPCALGSVKTNIGHLEPAAGVAGLIKTILALQHREIPAHLLLKRLNPHIQFPSNQFVIPTTARKWETDGRKRIAGVSSFGFGGTNVHVVLEEFFTAKEVSTACGSERVSSALGTRHSALLILSARSENALKNLAERYAQHIAGHPEQDIEDICFTAATGRAIFPHRLATVCENREETIADLSAFAEGETSRLVRTGIENGRPKIAFLFTGQGSQYAGAGAGLYRTEPVFRHTFDRCADLLKGRLEVDLREVAFGDSGALIHETSYTQPFLFTFGVALAELWRSWGIEPDAVAGHSVGEFAAASVAGVFSIEQGIELIAERARLMQSLPKTGGMAAVFAELSEFSELLKPVSERVSPAGFNAPGQTVLSGDSETLKTLLKQLEERGIGARKLTVSHAFHSPLMDPILDAFEAKVRVVQTARPMIPFVSNLTGKLHDADTVSDPTVWRRQLREPVRFADSMKTLAETGAVVFLEIGPHPVLTELGGRTLRGPEFSWLPSVRKGVDDRRTMLDALSSLFVAGGSINWAAVHSSNEFRKVKLPTYPFDRKKIALGPYSKADTAPRGGAAPEPKPHSHPLLGKRRQ